MGAINVGLIGGLIGAKFAILYMSLRALLAGSLPVGGKKYVRGSKARLFGLILLVLLVVATAILMFAYQGVTNGSLPGTTLIVAFFVDFGILLVGGIGISLVSRSYISE